MGTQDQLVEVRVEEVVIGALAGLGVGIAVASPIALGMPHLNPLAAGIGAWAAVQAGTAWACGIASATLGGWWMAHQPRDTHIEGSQYLVGRKARRAMQAVMRSRFSAAQKAGKVRGVTIGGVEFARVAEIEQMTVAGLQGGGKSTILTDMLAHALASGERVLIYDPSGDFIEHFYDPKSAVIMGAWDQRATPWDAAADIAVPNMISEFAIATIGLVDGENKSFYQGAATLLQGLILALRKRNPDGAWTWSDLAIALKLPPRRLAAFAATGDETVEGAVPSAFEKGNEGISRGDGSKFSILQSATAWVRAYGAVDATDKPHFSFARWLTGEDHRDIKLVFLNADSRYSAACTAIFGAILKSAISTIASTAMPRIGADEPGLWFVFDEAKQLGKPGLQQAQTLAELGRKRGVRVVVAVQDVSQLAAAVGEAEAKPMLAKGTHVYLRTSAEAAVDASKAAGEHTIERISTTSDNGAVQGKNKVVMREAAVLPSAFTSLRVDDGKGVNLIVSYGELYCRLFHPFSPRLPKIAKDQVESRAWISEEAESKAAGNDALRDAGLDPAAPVQHAYSMPSRAVPIRIAADDARGDDDTDWL